MSRSVTHTEGAPDVAQAAGANAARHPAGQAMVEFAIVLLPVLLILVGIIQFGLLFGANVTLTNAAREGARSATIYLYDRNQSKSWNDQHRCAAIVTAAENAFGLLNSDPPHFTVTVTSGACPTMTGDTLANGDLTVSYCDHTNSPSGDCPTTGDTTTTCIPDTREGCLVRVSLTYRSDIVVPLVGTFLGTDGYGRFIQRATATMVMN